MNFGKRRPGPALVACLLFGFLDAITPRLEGVAVFCGEGNALEFDHPWRTGSRVLSREPGVRGNADGVA